MKMTLDITLDDDLRLPTLTWTDEIQPPEIIREDQRRALFAAFAQVFDTCDHGPRHLFTRMILGKDVDAPVSWSRYDGQGQLTADEASRLLDVLDAVERTMVAT